MKGGLKVEKNKSMLVVTIHGTAGERSHGDEVYYGYIHDEDNFEEWMDGKYSFEPQIIESILTFKPIDGKLNSVVIYNINIDRKLTKEEMKYLIDKTSGQLSDGIGEGFSQVPLDIGTGEDIFLTPWHKGQKLVATQSILNK